MTKVAKENVDDIVALTPIQEGLLLTYLKEPGSDKYIVHSTVAIEGVVDEELFSRAWQGLVDRHQALRSTFRWENISRPVQIVLKKHPLEIRFVDLRTSLADGFREVKALDRQRGHDLGSVPFRITLARMADTHYQMVLSYHHVILDGWSLGVLAAEFLRGYEALSKGAPIELPAPTSLSRYVAWQQGQNSEEQKRFWSDYFRDYEGVRGLAVKRTLKASDTRSADLEQVIAPSLDREVRAFATSQGVTVASVLYAAFAVVLEKYNRTNDVVFGTTVSGRGAPVEGLAQMVGNFINTVPLRVRIEDGTVAGLCAAVAKSTNERREFDATSIVDVRRAIGMHEDPFDAIMVIENYPMKLASDDMRLGQLTSDEGEADYDLTVTVTLHEGLVVHWTYRSGRLDEGDVRRMSQRFESILAQFVNDPGASVHELDLMLPGEKKLVLEKFARGNVTAKKPPETFLEGFLEVLRDPPDHPAVVFEDEKLSYAELDQRSAQLARHLLSAGLPPEGRVAMLMERSADRIIALFAILRAGGVYVPITPNVPSKRIEYLLDDSEAQFVLVHAKTSDRLPENHRARVVNVSEPLARVDESISLPALRGDQLGYVMYTSGSTGQPKGVMTEHRAMMNTIEAFSDCYGFDRSTRTLLLFDCTANTSLEDIFCTLTRGGTLHVGTREMIFDRERFCNYVTREGITFISYLPSAFRELIPVDERLPSVKILVTGSESVPEELKNAMVRLGYAFYNGYGATEAGIDSLTQHCSERPISIGRPNDNTSCMLLDSRGRPCPIGIPGEIMLLGPGLARGYWKHDDLTATKFADCPALPGERMYRTGDLGLWQEDGEIRFLGRIDAQMNLNGFRVEPGEIEAAIVSHEKVREVVISVNRLSTGSAFLAAFVVCNSKDDVEIKNLVGKRLRTYLTERLPEHMIPNRFFALPELPRLSNGKVDATKLQSLLVDADAQEYVAPADDVEEKVALIWGSVLGRDKVTTATPFKELGGDSLMLTRIYSQLNRSFPGVLKVQDLFDHRTIQELAAVIRERTAPAVEEGAVNVFDF